MKIKNYASLLIIQFMIALGFGVCEDQSVDGVIARALEISPLVKQIEAKYRSEQGEGLGLKTLENPTIDSEVRVPSAYREKRGSDEVAVSLSQPLRLSDFGSRRKVNELIQLTADFDKRLALLELTQSLKLGYVKVWAFEERRLRIKEVRKQISQIEELVSKGSADGLYGEGEAKIFKVESLKLKNQQLGLESDAARARAELSRRAGFSVDGRLLTPPLNDPPPLSTISDDMQDIPAIERAKLAARLAEQQARLARLDSAPKFAPRLVYERTNDYADYYGVGISFDLPLFNRNQGEKIRRAAEASSAKASLDYFEGEQFQKEAAILRDALIASNLRARAYDREILPALREALTAQEKLLRAGQGSVFQVWQTLRELNSTEEEAIEQTVRAHSERTEFVILIGQEF